jgi:predicted secreted protein
MIEGFEVIPMEKTRGLGYNLWMGKGGLIRSDGQDIAGRYIIIGIIILFSGLCVGPVFGIGPGNAGPAGSEGKDEIVKVSIEDKDREIHVKTGAIIEIELETVGGAGYSWFFDGFKTEYFEILSEKTRTLSDRTGAPVTMVWRVRTKKPGAGGINMYNYRIWEGKGKAVNRFSMKITID